MSLTKEQILRLHLEDGVLDSTATADVAGLDFNPDDDLLFRRSVRHVLRPAVVPSIVDAVMTRIGQPSVPVSDAIHDQSAPAHGIAAEVMGHLEAREPLAGQIRAALREEAGDFVGAWPGVAGAIGVEMDTGLGGILRGAVAGESGYQAIGWQTEAHRNWRVPTAVGVLFAAAAAFLIWVGSAGSTAKEVAEKFAAGPVDIEHLDVGAASAVQVLQADEDATTIILIREDAGSQEVGE